MTVSRRERICALNDRLRKHHLGGRIVATQGVMAEGPPFLLAVLGELHRFDDFNEDNDPHGEHDFGSLSIDGETVLWKIDYYDQSLTEAAVDPSVEDGCVRVLTLMLAQEY